MFYVTPNNNIIFINQYNINYLYALQLESNLIFIEKTITSFLKNFRNCDILQFMLIGSLNVINLCLVLNIISTFKNMSFISWLIQFSSHVNFILYIFLIFQSFPRKMSQDVIYVYLTHNFLLVVLI